MLLFFLPGLQEDPGPAERVPQTPRSTPTGTQRPAVPPGTGLGQPLGPEEGTQSQEQQSSGRERRLFFRILPRRHRK